MEIRIASKYLNFPKPLLDALHMFEKQKHAGFLSEVLCAHAVDMKQKFPEEKSLLQSCKPNGSSESGHHL